MSSVMPRPLLRPPYTAARCFVVSGMLFARAKSIAILIGAYHRLKVGRHHALGGDRMHFVDRDVDNLEHFMRRYIGGSGPSGALQ
jgi:hypothetical protein